MKGLFLSQLQTSNNIHCLSYLKHISLSNSIHLPLTSIVTAKPAASFFKRCFSANPLTYQHETAYRPYQPAYQPTKHPCSDPEVLDNKLKVHDTKSRVLRYLSVNGVERTQASYLDDAIIIDERIPESQINALIDIIKDLNFAVLTEMEILQIDAYEHVKKEVGALVRSLMSQEESRKLLVEWVFDEELFSPEVFRLDQIRGFLVQTVLECGLEHATFADWNKFGDSFQDLMIQALKYMSLSDTEAFCKKFIGQANPSMKEKTYNMIVECFAFRYVPFGKLELGNSLLDEMVDAGLTPSSLAYENVIGFNVLTSFILNQTHEQTHRVKSLYFHHRKNREVFSMLNCHSLLCVFMPCSKHGVKESAALLEIIACLMSKGFFPTKRNCQVALDTIERLLDMYHPSWDHQLSESSTLDDRILVILKARAHIKELATADLFAILLYCFYSLGDNTRQVYIAFASIFFQALGEARWDRACFGALMNYYSKMDYFNGIQNTLDSMKAFNLIPDTNIIQIAIKYYVFKGPIPMAHALYNSLSSTPTPEIFSLMMVACSATHNFSQQTQLWKACLDSSVTLPSTVYSNAVRALYSYIRTRTSQQLKDEYADLHAHLQNIIESLDTKQLTGSLAFTYTLLIQIHGRFCDIFEVTKFQDFQRTYRKCLFGYKLSLLDSCYSRIFLTFKVFLSRNSALKPILLLETKKIAKDMAKHWPLLTCQTFFHLLSLLNYLGDELLFTSFMDQFRYMLSKNRIKDPLLAHIVFALEPKKVAVRNRSFVTSK